jgi:hypothetical protein
MKGRYAAAVGWSDLFALSTANRAADQLSDSGPQNYPNSWHNSQEQFLLPNSIPVDILWRSRITDPKAATIESRFRPIFENVAECKAKPFRQTFAKVQGYFVIGSLSWQLDERTRRFGVSNRPTITSGEILVSPRSQFC